MDVHTLTGLRVYTVLVAVLAEALRASLDAPGNLERVLWLFRYHWALTTPLMLATVVPSAAVAAVFVILSAALTALLAVLAGLATIVAARCGASCLSTLPYDSLRVGGLFFLVAYSFFATVYWMRTNDRAGPIQLRKRLSLLVLFGVVPACILLFSQRWYFMLPAFAFDPTVFWLIHINRPHSNGLAFVALCALVVLDALHLLLFLDGPYLYNILVLRTSIDVGRIYLRLTSI